MTKPFKQNASHVSLCQSGKAAMSFAQIKEKRIAGSLTVEAALVVPFCFFVIMAFLYFFSAMELEIILQNEMFETGRKIGATSSLANIVDEDENSLLFSEGSKFAVGALIEEGIREKGIPGLIGKFSCDFSRSVLYDEFGCLELVCDYLIEPKLPIRLGTASLHTQRVLIRCFDGCGGIESEEDDDDTEGDMDYVYVCENGTVYHRSPDCTYLKLSVTAIDASLLASARNASGARYAPCEICSEGRTASGTVYVAKYGTAWHLDRGCSGLKRTVKKVDRKTLTGIGPCSKCAAADKEGGS